MNLQVDQLYRENAELKGQLNSRQAIEPLLSLKITRMEVVKCESVSVRAGSRLIASQNGSPLPSLEINSALSVQRCNSAPSSSLQSPRRQEPSNFKFFLRAFPKLDSLVYQDGQIQVGLRIEPFQDYFVGKIFIRNIADSSIENLSTEVVSSSNNLQIKMLPEQSTTSVMPGQAAYQ